MVYLVSIPRDTWIPLPVNGEGQENFKINAAYAIGRDNRRYTTKPREYTGEGGGGALAKYAAGQVLGMPVHYFVSLSFEGFKKSIDELDGVDVIVPHTFDDYLYPLEEEKDNNCGKTDEQIKETEATLSGDLLEKEYSCRYEHLHFDQGEEHMDGGRALKFARSRKSEQFGGDYNRSIRQQALLSALKDKIIRVNFIPRAVSFISSLTSDMQTDISPAIATKKLSAHADITSFTIQTINISDLLIDSRSADGQYILIPTAGEGNWEEIHAFINGSIGN
jgi:anionic cell wall polymer biosynthesis LytR-Cps2A-Psr (LCP) family protein